MHRKVAAALVAVLALGIASCGSSEKTLTRAQLVSRIELACRQGKQAMARPGREVTGAAGEQGHFIAAVLAGQRVVLDRLKGVTTSGSAKSDFDALKQGMQQRLDVIARVQKAGRAKLQSAIRAAQPEAEAVTRKVQAAETALGVTGCV